ncbi:MAG: MBL fold metallo-hydrolase [Clostridia bacterium]|nr:MBL fold metallo-hydrolase [Clostridia bacterium]
MHQRKTRIIKLIIVALISAATVLSLCACAKSGSLFGGYSETEKAILNSGFSAHFIDVGEGDSSVFKFPDGKVLMIDTGTDGEKTYGKIKAVLDGLSVKNIDYLVLSHPDTEHVGNAGRLLSDYTVGKLYMPNILEDNKEYFPEFSAVYQNMGTSIIVNPKLYDRVSGEDYFFAFLSPKDDDYAALNLGSGVDEKAKDDVSPVIYLEYAGVRFLISSDATATVEQRIVTDYSVVKTMFDRLGFTVDLEDIEFYKVAAHGDVKSNSEAFLNLIRPKRSIISVGGANYKGHPATTVLNRLIAAREDCEFYRTDYFGTVSVLVSESGETTVKKER